MAIRIHLRELLAQRGMTQVELEARTGLAFTTINRLVQEHTERIDLNTLDALCSALGCRVGDILEYVPSPKSRRS